MRLAATQDVVTLSGIPSGDGVLGNAGAALDVSSQLIAEALGTRLDAVTYTDYFSYAVSAYRKKFSPAIFRLTAGFIDLDSLVVRRSVTSAPLFDAETGTIMTLGTDYLIDGDKGLLTLIKDVNEGTSTLSATYDAGFGTNSEKVIQGAPEWLTRAGQLAAVRIIQMNPASIGKGKAGIAIDIQNAMFDAISGIINPHKRPRMGYSWPDRSVAE